MYVQAEDEMLNTSYAFQKIKIERLAEKIRLLKIKNAELFTVILILEFV